MSKIKDTDYISLSATLRAKEAKMLTKEKLERLLTEPSFTETARMLVDNGYPDMSGMNSQEINAVLEKHRNAQVEEVAGAVKDQTVVDVFRLKYEYHNVKTLVKSNGELEKNKRLLSTSGRTELDKLIEAYETADYDGLNETVAAAMEEAKVVLARTGNPQLADFILDKAYFAELLDIADSTKNKFIKGYVQTLIDSANMRSALRAILIGKKDEILSQALAKGGSIDVDAILMGIDTREDLAKAYASTSFAKAAEAENITKFELEADNAVLAYLADSMYVSFGPEVVLSYLAAIENEIMAIRIILTGKLMGIDTQLLRERLRDSYV